MNRIRVPALALAAVLLTGAAANDPADRLANLAQEAHARALFKGFRCVQCQNQSIDESDAPIAEDLRTIVRQQVAAGRSDGEIRRYMVQRYGVFILERPTFSPANAVLWGAPFAIVLVGLGALAMRRRRPPETRPLTAEEEARLATLTADPRSGA